ncbi:MAG: hypothetical protein LC745_01420 [Planctomycetia bacterium]|nr:hypothetical protein [Planctomycetia bacterium]
MNDVPILVCDCGKKLRAPGAVPGRLGRCPACGGAMRVPAPATAPPPAPPGERTGGPNTEAAPRPTTRVPGRDRNGPTGRREPEGLKTTIWNGVVKAPGRVETGLRDSLLYPLWGANGIALLVFLPPLLWFASVPTITMVTALSGSESAFGVGAMLILIPSGLGLLAVLGYSLLFLGRVLATSAIGEVHHPHMPDWDLSNIYFGLGRWLWAGFTGGLIGGIPGVAYWIYCGTIDPFDVVILTELTALGAVYALMALLASILHEDVLAAGALWGVLSQVPSLKLAVAALGGFWVFALYEAMVVFRVLGLFYHRHARALGWFRDRTRWGG